MRAKIQRWGNSLGLRIPKPFAEEVGLADDAEVELSLSQGGLVVRPLRSWALADLVRGITRANQHGEEFFGPATGREVW
jgi:antitoxin MazE